MQWIDRKKNEIGTLKTFRNNNNNSKKKSVGEDDKDREKELIRSNNTK